MTATAKEHIPGETGYGPLLAAVGLEGERVFTHPDIKPWRQLADRENCTMDVARPEGGTLRLHIKRYAAVRSRPTPAELEAEGIRLLCEAGLPTVSLVAWANLPDRRSYVILEDLAGYRPADKLIAEGVPFERLAPCTAELSARLHRAGLHHRDLYLCHFFVRMAGEDARAPGDDVKLIDAARVRKLPRFFFRMRWVIKDLAEFWYSAMRLGIGEPDLLEWLRIYAIKRQMVSPAPLRDAVKRKVSQIARHDERLCAEQPKRNISIPE